MHCGVSSLEMQRVKAQKTGGFNYLCIKLGYMHFSLIEILAAFMVLFAIIDIPGSIPIIIDIKAKSGEIKAAKVTLVSFLILLAFLFIGSPLLGIFCLLYTSPSPR